MGDERAPNGDPPGQLPTAALVALTAELTRAGDADAVARTLARRLVELFDAADVDIWRLVGAGLRCVASCERGGRFDESVVGTVLDLGRATAAAWTVEHREPLILTNTDDPRLSPMERSAFEDYGFVTSLSIPLVIEGAAVGLVDLYDDRPRDWSPDVDVATMVAQMAAGVFRAALALEEARESNASLRTLVDAAVEIGSSLDFDAVLDSVARKMCQVSGGVACELFSVDGDHVTSLIYVVDGESLDVDLGRVYDEREYYIRADELRDPRLIEVPDIAAETEASAAEVEEWLKNGWHSGVALPLLAAGAVIGQAFVYDRVPRRWNGLDTLRGLAQIAAQAMTNATLHREATVSAERLRTANEIGLQLVSRLSVDEATAATATRLCRMLDAANCDIWELDDGELHCLLSVEDGHPDERWADARVVASEWPTWMGVIESGQPLLIDDVTAGNLSTAEKAWFAESATESTLVLPLLGRAGFRGTLDFCGSGSRRRFTAHDAEVAGAYTAVVTLALENARLFEDLRARRWEAELINRLARDTSATLDVAEISAAALDALADTVPCERAAVVLAGDDGALRVVQARPERCLPLEGVTLTVLDDRLLRRLLSDGTARIRLPAEREQLGGVVLDDELADLLVVLLVSGAEPIGAVFLASTEEGAFSGVDAALLRRFGEHLSVVFRNARLYEQLRRRHAANLVALDVALGAKDPYTVGHPARVAAYAILLGRRLGWTEATLNEVAVAGALHDIGQLGVSGRLLRKPGPLAEHEWELIRQHPDLSAEIVRPLCSEAVVLGVRHHHERWDGGGYPDGLAGGDIPDVARAMCIAESYDAVSMTRPYREALDCARARDELRECAGSQFDPVMVAEFLAVLDDLQDRKRAATAVAAEAAAGIEADTHARLRSRHDELTEEYGGIRDFLREVRDRHPGTADLSTCALRGGRAAYIVDAMEDPARRSELGAAGPADEELLARLTGDDRERCVLWARDGQVYVCGYAPVRDGRGRVEAMVTADVPLAGIPRIGGSTDVAAVRGFDSRLRFATGRLTRAEVEAMTDGLTGLANHRHFHERLAEEAALAAAGDGTLTLLFIDIDGFKGFNDRFGHRAGDEALRIVARAILSSVRCSDVAARYGGEEFAVLLPGVAVAGAAEIAERMRAEVLRLVAREGPAPDCLTVSIGVAVVPDHAHDKDDLLERADLAMYAAKRCGKDRVFVFGTADPS